MTILLFFISLTPFIFADHPLILQNQFKTPVALIEHYCERDGAGFFWTGMLEAERKNLTTWKETPHHDGFYVAKKYNLVPQNSSYQNEGRVDVRYELVGISDAHGTTLPAPEKDYWVSFSLKKINGKWKIVSPEPSQIIPVLLEGKISR